MGCGGMMGTFCILIMAGVVQIYKYVKIHGTVHQRKEVNVGMWSFNTYKPSPKPTNSHSAFVFLACHHPHLS